MKTIVIGMLNTDLVLTGVERFPGKGQHVVGNQLTIGPGGKSRNIADMVARLSPTGSVAMVGRTVKDNYGLWEAPVRSLEVAGVDSKYIAYSDEGMPSIAFIPVDNEGNNQIYILPGVGDDFIPADIDKAKPLFEEAAKEGGMLITTLECPLETVMYAVKLAKNLGLKVMLDPGGISPSMDTRDLIGAGLDIIKPNEHEAAILTGLNVIDFASAEKAANKLLAQGVGAVIITAGSNGAYLFSAEEKMHIPSADGITGEVKDETGCGDQTMAVLCAMLQEGKLLKEATELAVKAGTMQFYRQGIQPVSREELGI
jgi:ribokinase